MAEDRREQLTPGEWKVMKIIWRQKACAARDVCDEACQAHGWAISTVKTVLRRLVEKGHLTTQQVGNSFLYRPSRPALRSLRAAADALLDNALEGTTGPLLAHMIRKSRLSPEELDELRALLDERGLGTEKED